MNELSELTAGIKSGDAVILPCKTYSVAPEDSFRLTGLHFSNTAKYEENPLGKRFCGIFLENKENVIIDGNGSTVLIHGIMTPFIFKNCKNIVMKNFTFDHYRPTMSEFTIVSSKKGKAVIKINEEFLYELRKDGLYWVSENDFGGKPYWENRYKGPKILSNRLRPDIGIIDEVNPYSVGWGFPDVVSFKKRDDGLIEIEFDDSSMYYEPGTVIQTRNVIRSQTGGAIDECSDVRLDNLRIMSMNCFGILGQNSRNIEYYGIDCTPKKGRTIVSDADFFHFSGCSGRLTIKNCKAKGAHDDVINVHGTHLKIIGTDTAEKSVTVRYSHPESRGFNPYKNGDSIEFVCGNTLLPYHNTCVTGIEQLTDTDFKVEVDTLPDCIPAANDVIENVSRTAELIVENNVFELIPSRAILCTTRRNVVIKNNTFRNMGGPVLCVANDANFWFESGRSGTICFENNSVFNCGARELDRGCDVIRYEPVVMDKSSKIPVHEKLIAKGNEFINTNSEEYTINLNYLKTAEITDNKCNAALKIKNDGIAKIRELNLKELI